MAKHPQTLFTLHMLYDCLDGFCSQEELDWLGPMLAKMYSTYRLPHRKGFLDLVLSGEAHMEPDQHKQAILVARATEKHGKDFESLNSQQQKQLAQNYGFKLRRLALECLPFIWRSEVESPTGNVS